MQTANNLLQVEYWRNEFKAEQKRLGRDWRKRLVQAFPRIYDSFEGTTTMLAVKDGKASIQRTAQVVNDMKATPAKGALILPKKSRKPDTKKTQTLAELEARRRQRKNIAQ